MRSDVVLVIKAILVIRVNTEQNDTKIKLLQRSYHEEGLVGHVIQSTQVTSDIDCLVECFRERRCLSFNYKSSKGDGNPVCELNDQTRQSRPHSIVSLDGYYYYGPESSCISDLCLNGGTCLPVLDNPDKRYQCECSPGFTGQRCQNDNSDFDINFPRQSGKDYVMMVRMPHQLTKFTVSLFVNLTKDVDHSFVSYATPTFDNAILLQQKPAALWLWINDLKREFTPHRIKADGAWHHLAMTWENVNGAVSMYIDGIKRILVKNFAIGRSVELNGTLAIGNDQDKIGGGFADQDALCGSISRVNIWNTILSSDVIASLSGRCGNEAGTVVAWKDFRKDAPGVTYHGQTRYILPSTCKLP